MERRDFLKYFLSLSAIGCSGCRLSKADFDASDKIELVKDGVLQTIKIPICYHCNLNCASCCHFSPVAPKYEMPAEIFEKDLKQLEKITNGKLKVLKLLGGEPLLHNNIEKLLAISNNYFPLTDKRIISNGLLLEEMSENFWKICSKYHVMIDVRNYVKYNKKKIDVSKCFKLAQKYNVKLKIASSADRFKLSNLSKTGQYHNARSKKYKCPQLDNGLISPCAIISNIKFFNAYFKEHALPVVESDYLNIYKISSVEEINEYFSKEKQLCKYCGYGSESTPWHLSEYKLSEWYKI